MLNRRIYIDLEGADLTGKSTLLKTTFKEGDYSKIMCFHDRGIMTHYVYNKCFNRYPEDLDMWFNGIIEFLKYGKGGIIILTASENTLRHRFLQRNDDFFKLDKILAVNDEYIELYFKLSHAYDTLKLISTDNKTPKEIYKEATALYGKMYLKGIE
jgi:thymidylate kinase